MTRQEKLDAIAASLTEFDWQQYVDLPDSYDRYDQVKGLAQKILDKVEPSDPDMNVMRRH